MVKKTETESNSMKIFIPFSTKDIGGTSTFVGKFSKQLIKRGFVIIFNFEKNFDVLFIITDCSLFFPLYAKIKRKKIIQRLDGVYHPATPTGKRYWFYNLKMKIIHNFFADTVIYQSEFSKTSCEKFLGKTKAKEITIIYNGVDIEKIQPRENPTPHSPLKLLTFAKFRRRDQIEPIIESVKLLDPNHFSLDIYGSYTENLTYLFQNLPSHIHFKGKKDNEALLTILNQYDVFLFSDQSACPNSVLEAMAAGLPVVAFNRGSISEIIENEHNGYHVNVINHNPFTNSYPFSKESYEKFSKIIQEIPPGRLSRLKIQTNNKARERFNIKSMTQKYINILT
jgi:glycosyltransferase involved in cell wall biosynthesis